METKTAKDWIKEGNEFLDEKKYTEAISCYDKALGLEPDKFRAWSKKGYALYSLKRYKEAIKYCDRAIEIYPNNFFVWRTKGYVLTSLKRYEEAIACFDKAISINPNDPLNWDNKGVTLEYLERYKEAIECYDKAIELNPENDVAWNNKGYALKSLERYKEAIVCYDKAIELNSKNNAAWNNKSSALNSWKRYKKAIKCYDREDVKLDNWAYRNKAVSFVKLHHKHPDTHSLEEAMEFLKGSKLCPDIIDIYSRVLSQLAPKEKMEIALQMIKEDTTYKQISIRFSLTEDDKEKHYKELYIKSRYILSLLHVKGKDARQGVAHYTTPQMLRTSILEDQEEEEEEKNETKHPSPLRLYLINLSNDPSEGRTLMDYLYGRYTPVEDNGIVALAASFTFNRDCLNQFRLYGKDDKKEKEGAGVSIIVTDSFFEDTAKAPSEKRMKWDLLASRNITTTETEKTPESKETNKKPNNDKGALYRCMYVDPETQQVISLGQREEYTFYRDKLIGKKNNKEKKQIKEQVEKDIKKYRKDMNNLVGEVQKEMDVILGIIEKHKLDFNIVAELLVDLRCLTKHVAFRVEQECRIVKVVDCNTNNDLVKPEDDYHQLYMDYLPLIPDSNNPEENHIKEVCFGPHFKHREVYAAELSKLGIPSSRSTHPLA